MSLRSALDKAKELQAYIEDIKAGKFEEVYKAENGNYYKDSDFTTTTVILGLNSKSPADFSQYNPDAEFISYAYGGEIRFYNRSRPLKLNFEVLKGPWDSEEYYFQNSTLYDDEVLDTLVIMWYFKSIDSTRFYLDYEYVRAAHKGKR